MWRTWRRSGLAATLWLVPGAICAGDGKPAGLQSGTCNIRSVTPLAFGTYDTTSGAESRSNATINFNCPSVKSVVIDISAGSSGSFLDRTMTSGANRLHYNVYVDATTVTPWGDGRPGTDHYVKVNPGSETLTVFGRIPARQSVASGEYTDGLLVTFLF